MTKGQGVQIPWSTAAAVVVSENGVQELLVLKNRYAAFQTAQRNKCADPEERKKIRDELLELIEKDRQTKPKPFIPFHWICVPK